MFRFNAAVMGMADREWMYEVLDCFDAMVRNVANSFRLQETGLSSRLTSHRVCILKH